MQAYLTQLLEKSIESLPRILSALLILIVSVYLSRVVSRWLKRILERHNTAGGAANLLSQSLRWLIITFGVITALQRFFDVTAFLAGLGILGFTVGFALQDIMKNIASGVILLIQKPFQRGDTIGSTSYTGTILAIDLRTTEMETLDGRVVILPNATILSNPIENYTRANRRRVEVSFGVAYDSKAEQVRALILDALRSIPGFVSEPEPIVVFHSFGASSLELTAYFWVDTKRTNPPAATDAALTSIKTVFEDAHVELPQPVQSVLVRTEK